MSKSVSMKKVYDVFAEQTRKQARLYGLETPRKTYPTTSEGKRRTREAIRRAEKALEPA